MTDKIVLKKEEGKLSIIFNNPDKKNALTSDMYHFASNEINKAESDLSVSVIILSGSGGSFSSGNDLFDFINDPYNPSVINFLESISSSSLPIVAAVNGVAVGIGATMLLHCDFVYSSPDTYFSFPFIDLGLVPEAAASLLLPKLVGHKKASELLMLGKPFYSEEALEMGFISKICPEKNLLDEVNNLANLLTTKPRESLCLTKKLLCIEEESVTDRMAREHQKFRDLLGTKNTQNIINAILNKKKNK